MTVLVVATGNPGKLGEIQAYFPPDSGWQLQLKPAELEVEETGETFIDNACLKASQVAIATGEWAIAVDSGLAVDALNGAPGIYSARYAETDADRIVRLLAELGNRADRQAQFICAIAVASPEGQVVIQEEGICPGEILTAPRGTQGFGYDPIFYVPEAKLSFAEMPADLKHHLSHRGRAFDRVLPQLVALQKTLS